jgi:hypothetical protein
VRLIDWPLRVADIGKFGARGGDQFRGGILPDQRAQALSCLLAGSRKIPLQLLANLI